MSKSVKEKASGSSDDVSGMSVEESARQPLEVANGAQGMASATVRVNDDDDPSEVYIGQELDGLRSNRGEAKSRTDPTRSYGQNRVLQVPMS